jgi:hypothetical protein
VEKEGLEMQQSLRDTLQRLTNGTPSFAFTPHRTVFDLRISDTTPISTRTLPENLYSAQMTTVADAATTFECSMFPPFGTMAHAYPRSFAWVAEMTRARSTDPRAISLFSPSISSYPA